jgi:predicted transcriptional regulator
MAATQNYSLRLDAGRRSQLEAIAQRKDRDLSYVIRKAIDEYIDRHKDDPE